MFVIFVCDFYLQDKDKAAVLIVMNNLPFSFKSIDICSLGIQKGKNELSKK